MGEVWKARDAQLERDVALKFSKDSFAARFDREAAPTRPSITPMSAGSKMSVRTTS
jgi:hypothetical protein